jgi:hypothetical protein
VASLREGCLPLVKQPDSLIRASPPIVLRRTTEAVDFIRKVGLSRPPTDGKPRFPCF